MLRINGSQKYRGNLLREGVLYDFAPEVVSFAKASDYHGHGVQRQNPSLKLTELNVYMQMPYLTLI